MIKLYKFLIGRDFKTLPSDPSMSYAMCSIIVAAYEVGAAREHAKRIGKLNGADTRWVDIADVTEIDTDTLEAGQLIGWNQ